MHNELVPYKTMPVWTAETLPRGFRKQHNTKEGTWARLTVTRGQLTYHALDADGVIQSTHVFSKDRPAPFVEPQAWHRVEPASDDLECFLTFYCRPERYYEKKYRLTAPHSEVVELVSQVAAGYALDLGCGRGRNAIFLAAHGFAVTALDKSESSIAKLDKIIAAEEACRGIKTGLYDAASAAIQEEFDLVIATVMLQFLPADTVPAVIENIQRRTRPGGVNLIVAPMSTVERPCPIDWPFTFRENQLQAHYAGWQLIKYNEDLGQFHRLDERGRPYECQFATLAARKVVA